MTMYSICAFIALLVSFPLARYWGGWGCAIATASALVVSTGFIMNRYYAKRIHLDIVLFWKNILSLMKGSFLLLLVGFGLDYMLQLSLSWRNFVVLCAIDTAFYIVIMYTLCMNEEEKNLCRRVIGKILRTA